MPNPRVGTIAYEAKERLTGKYGAIRAKQMYDDWREFDELCLRVHRERKQAHKPE